MKGKRSGWGWITRPVRPNPAFCHHYVWLPLSECSVSGQIQPLPRLSHKRQLEKSNQPHVTHLQSLSKNGRMVLLRSTVHVQLQWLKKCMFGVKCLIVGGWSYVCGPQGPLRAVLLDQSCRHVLTLQPPVGLTPGECDVHIKSKFWYSQLKHSTVIIKFKL